MSVHVCLCRRLRELAAGTNCKGQSTITSRRGAGGGGGGGREEDESGLVCLVRSDKALLTVGGEGEAGGEG